ncbi:uncharacterized protein KD926_001645 [Aspergillus affinis]|uniref:uncharacterized protein n=1 Tax=Aspergillus affinis TaxID=1070780 RepID=UPI0022FEF8B0|nr:uncharacterized protein KD926_001645 [Aspergillus affinis]KAI9036632.1 hypothetical protein KD926_001645 [Aspergillus affinis]
MYISLYSNAPRSFLFCVVANVGPRGTSRSLAVAYRQGRDSKILPSSLERMNNVVADTLALIEILSDPANRAPLEAERALAEDRYRRFQRDSEDEGNWRPSVPDTSQPPFVVPDSSYREEQAQPLPDLPWRDDGPREFPFTTTCLLLGLLRDDGTRPGDIQLQPLSTVFRGDCNEYGLIVLDISDLDSGVKYGIVAFPVRYMAEVFCHGPDWDPIEDQPPVKEPDVVLVSPRPRVPLSIVRWIRKYLHCGDPEKDPNVLKLEDRPVVDGTALDYIWPPELEDEDEATVEIQARPPSQGVISSISNYFWPSKSTSRASYASTTTISQLTTLDEPLRKAHINRAIDNLLLLTQQHGDLPLDKNTIDNFQQLAEFREQVRRRLEEVPDRLGPSEVSVHILRVAYAGCMHLNWVAFRNLAPNMIAAAVASDELRGASALSLCVDQFKLERDEGDLGDLAAVLAQSTALKQLCFLQRPDRDSDDASAHFCTRLLLQGRSSRDLGWLRDKTIYPTFAFSTPLRSRRFTSPSTISAFFTFPVVQVSPVMHIFTFVGQRKDAADAHHHLQKNQNSYCYYIDMSNTFLDAERFSVRFLSYLRSVGSGSNKAVLRFAYEGTSSLTTTTDGVDNFPPPSASSALFAVSPIPAGILGSHLAARVRVRDIHPGSWVLLLDQRGRSSSDDEEEEEKEEEKDADADDTFLRYCFVKIRRSSAEITQQQQQGRPVPNLAEVVGGLTEFLRNTVPGIDICTWEERVEQAEKDFHARRASVEPGKRCIGISVMAESRARALLEQLL